VYLAADRRCHGGIEDRKPALSRGASGHRRARAGGEALDESGRETGSRFGRLGREAQCLEYTAFFEGVSHLFLPVGAELRDASVQFLTELAVQFPSLLVTRHRSDNCRSQVPKRYPVQLCDSRLRPVEPCRLLDRRGELLCEGQDGVAGSFGTALGASALAVLGHCSTDSWYAAGGETLHDGSLLGRKSGDQGISVRRPRLESRGCAAGRGLGLARA